MECFIEVCRGRALKFNAGKGKVMLLGGGGKGQIMRSA